MVGIRHLSKRFVLPSLPIKALYILSHQDCENIETITVYILFSLFRQNNWRKKAVSSRVLLTSCLLMCCWSIHFVDVQQVAPKRIGPAEKKIPGKYLEDLISMDYMIFEKCISVSLSLNRFTSALYRFIVFVLWFRTLRVSGDFSTCPAWMERSPR